MLIRFLFAVACLTGFVSTLSAQNYSPRAGETVLRLSIEGKGDLFIKLFTKEAPKTTARIVDLTGKKFYDGQRFFKVVRQPKDFMAQVGDPDSKTKDIDDPTLGTGGTGSTIAFEESGHPNIAGAVGLSTLEGKPDTGDCQFYVLLGNARFLDGKYTVFGQVVAGTDLLSKIELGDRIRSATILRG